MTTSAPMGEDGQQQQQQQQQQRLREAAGSSDPDVPSVRDIVRLIGLLIGGVVLVMIVVVYVWGNSPMGIQDRAHDESLIRAELGVLLPYPGSALIGGLSVTNSWDKPVWVTGSYSMTPGACRSVHSYYANLAPKHGWRMTRPLTAGSDQPTTLSTFFGKTVGGSVLEMLVECREGDSYYDVAIHTG